MGKRRKGRVTEVTTIWRLSNQKEGVTVNCYDLRWDRWKKANLEEKLKRWFDMC